MGRARFLSPFSARPCVGRCSHASSPCSRSARSPRTALAADPPGGAPPYEDGPTGRALLGGTWLFRVDPFGAGDGLRFERQASTTGWSRVRVPHAWNANDPSDASMLGTIGWYRRDFTLPRASSIRRWLVRFGSVNNRARVWLNGRRLGDHTGAYLPWELPLTGLRAQGVNRLVVRVDSRRRTTDFPPARTAPDGRPSGGWWNYAGLLREVEVRPVDGLDIPTVDVRPVLACRRCAAQIRAAVTVENAGSRAERVTLTGRHGSSRLTFAPATVEAGETRVFRTTLRIARPRLWEPGSPTLHQVVLDARGASGGRAGYRLRSGIRSTRVAGGRLLLNDRPVNFRGVGLHEDARGMGAALDRGARRELVAQARELGAGLLRSHYPLHPRIHELADRYGLLIWSEVPVWQVPEASLAKPELNEAAVALLERNVVEHRNHPSVLLWSIGNELAANPGPGTREYIAAGRAAARRLDPSRPVSISIAGRISDGCQDAYAPLDVIGAGEYYGWYPGPGGEVADTEALGSYLDLLRLCYPSKAIAITEFGAEANRDGPEEERGTYAFQRAWAREQLAILASRRWLSGAAYWTLREFWARPNWTGGIRVPRRPATCTRRA